jgi:hypothetical protein
MHHAQPFRSCGFVVVGGGNCAQKRGADRSQGEETVTAILTGEASPTLLGLGVSAVLHRGYVGGLIENRSGVRFLRDAINQLVWL